MAYRRTVFDELEFDERLQRFGGYAWLEDSDLSHRVFLHFGRPLLIVGSAHVVHIAANEGKGRTKDMAAHYAMTFYNTKIVFDNYCRYARYSKFGFFKARRAFYFIHALSTGHLKDCIKGWKMYREALREDHERS